LPIAIIGVFPLLLFLLLPSLPEAPRYLLYRNRDAEALEVLAATRAEGDTQNKAVQVEYDEVSKTVTLAKQNAEQSSFYGIFTRRGFGEIHFVRRAQLALWLPFFTQIGTGSPATTIYAPTLPETAGSRVEKTNWLSALYNTMGTLGTVISMFAVNPVGRRKTLLWGALAQSATKWIMGAMATLTTSRREQAKQCGAASVAFVFVFTLIQSSTLLTDK